MNLISELLNRISPVEPDWCCERCRLAAEAAAADKVHGPARAISTFSRQPTNPPLPAATVPTASPAVLQ